MSPMLAEVLGRWRQQTPYAHPSDWILASTRLKGGQPRTASILAVDHLRPGCYRGRSRAEAGTEVKIS
jgi:hypothetical protein